MGRRPDNPADQRAKGYPGKRKSRVEKQIAEAERLAALLAAAPAQPNDGLAPPSFITDPRLLGALAVWNDYAPQLANIHLLDESYRHTFAMFCVYVADFVAAQDELLRNGYSSKVKTVSGSFMFRENPAVSRRDTAADYVIKLSTKFGLSPLDRYALMKDQAALPPGGLFPGHPAPPKPDEQPPATEDDPIGMLARLDSPPPERPH